MSLTPTALLILATCWTLPALVLAVMYVLRRSGSPESPERSMMVSTEEVRADIQEVDLEPRRQGWRSEDWDGPGARVRAQVQSSSQEVTVQTPHAEASVTVSTPQGVERRQCSVCLN